MCFVPPPESVLKILLFFLVDHGRACAGHVGSIWHRLRPAIAAPLKDSVPSITTNGVASTEVVPDIATISIGVDTERPHAADAARENARATQAVVGEIKAQGIEAKDVRTLSITLSPVSTRPGSANGRINETMHGYDATNSMHVAHHNMTKASTLAAS